MIGNSLFIKAVTRSSPEWDGEPTDKIVIITSAGELGGGEAGGGDEQRHELPQRQPQQHVPPHPPRHATTTVLLSRRQQRRRHSPLPPSLPATAKTQTSRTRARAAKTQTSGLSRGASACNVWWGFGGIRGRFGYGVEEWGSRVMRWLRFGLPSAWEERRLD